MPKIKNQNVFVCSACKFETPRWQGKCANCGEWNTLHQEARFGSGQTKVGRKPGKVYDLSKLTASPSPRLNTGIAELNAVLGGGAVVGSVVLLGGDPGIGKSTLALQLAVNLAAKGHEVLYISGEESAQQIKLRADRLNARASLPVLADTNLDTLLATLAEIKPDLAIVDSIQTILSDEVSGTAGGVSQVAYATNALIRLAKSQDIAVLIIGHVTKEGLLAGPKTLEHMVDTVLYLEGERLGNLRLLRCAKNRFGGIGEIGVFEMRETGLVEVKNPSAAFLEHRDGQLFGSCITAVLEGNKVLLVEVQALVSPSHFGYPKRTASGFDLNRLQLICAVLQKILKLNLSNQDVYVNVAGGFNVEERAADLPVALAILSSFTEKCAPENCVVCGELGLLGEVRSVSQAEKRAKEAEKLGFASMLLGGKQAPKLPGAAKIKIKTIGRLQELLKELK